MSEEFTVKDILEMMIEFKSDVKGLQTEMIETRSLLKSYNGLRQKMMDFEVDYAKFKQEVMTTNLCRKDNKTDWKWLMGWIIAIGSLLFNVLS